MHELFDKARRSAKKTLKEKKRSVGTESSKEPSAKETWDEEGTRLLRDLEPLFEELRADGLKIAGEYSYVPEKDGSSGNSGAPAYAEIKVSYSFGSYSGSTDIGVSYTSFGIIPIAVHSSYMVKRFLKQEILKFLEKTDPEQLV